MPWVSSRKIREEYGVNWHTLKRWKQAGLVKTIKGPSGRDLYDPDSFVTTSGDSPEPRVSIVYARVSTAQQKNDLERQKQYLVDRFPNHQVVSDVGSGLNYKRKGLLVILQRLQDKSLEELVVASKDRLVRFGFELFEQMCKLAGTKLTVLDDDYKTPEGELADDLLSVVTVFATRRHGRRRYKRTNESKEEDQRRGEKENEVPTEDRESTSKPPIDGHEDGEPEGKD